MEDATHTQDVGHAAGVAPDPVSASASELQIPELQRTNALLLEKLHEQQDTNAQLREQLQMSQEKCDAETRAVKEELERVQSRLQFAIQPQQCAIHQQMALLLTKIAEFKRALQEQALEEQNAQPSKKAEQHNEDEEEDTKMKNPHTILASLQAEFEAALKPMVEYVGLYRKKIADLHVKLHGAKMDVLKHLFAHKESAVGAPSVQELLQMLDTHTKNWIAEQKKHDRCKLNSALQVREAGLKLHMKEYQLNLASLRMEELELKLARQSTVTHRSAQHEYIEIVKNRQLLHKAQAQAEFYAKVQEYSVIQLQELQELNKEYIEEILDLREQVAQSRQQTWHEFALQQDPKVISDQILQDLEAARKERDDLVRMNLEQITRHNLAMINFKEQIASFHPGVVELERQHNIRIEHIGELEDELASTQKMLLRMKKMSRDVTLQKKELEQKHQAALQELEQKHQAAQQELQQQLEAQQQSYSESCQELQVAQMLQELLDEFENMQQNCQQKLDKFQQQVKRGLEQTRKEQDETRQKLEHQAAKYVRRSTQLREQLRGLMVKHDAYVDDHEQRMVRLQEQHAEELRQQKLCTEELKQQLQTAKQSALDKKLHKSQVQRRCKQVARCLVSLLEELTEELGHVLLLINQVEAERVEENAGAELEQTREELEQTREELQQTREELAQASVLASGNPVWDSGWTVGFDAGYNRGGRVGYINAREDFWHMFYFLPHNWELMLQNRFPGN